MARETKKHLVPKGTGALNAARGSTLQQPAIAKNRFLGMDNGHDPAEHTNAITWDDLRIGPCSSKGVNACWVRKELAA
jgi:hypothetical protein